MVLISFSPAWVTGQTKPKQRYSLNFQSTVIQQGKFASRSTYDSTNSLTGKAAEARSLTSTLFLDVYLSKRLTVKINPEMAGGSGLSQARGLGGFSNGETFRIGNPAPALYLARGVLEYTIPLGSGKMIRCEDHPLNDSIPEEGLLIGIGKFSLMDYLDGNSFSHDPRDQFLNWGLMSSGAYDYGANTRGYTVGAVVNYFSPNWELSFACNQLPTYANGPDLDKHITKAFGLNFSVERKWTNRLGKGVVRTLVFYNQTKMASYSQATKNPDGPDLASNRQYGRSKTGIAISAEQVLGIDKGIFARLSWNDGHNETWAFTEIDHSVAIGFQGSGFRQSKKDADIWGIAFLGNGLSPDHRNFLKRGGLGFMLGDGRLNYAPELILESYYRFSVPNTGITISPDLQFVANPGYNADRGPVLLYAVRFHVEM